MPLDDKTIRKVSKKYTSNMTRQWSKPSSQLLQAVEDILMTNKSKCLEMVPSKKINSQNIAMTNFINDFMADFSRTKLPKATKLDDFDYDYQLKRQSALLNRESNEKKIVRNLKRTLIEEEDKLNQTTKFLKSYEKLNEEEDKKLRQVMDEFEIEHSNEGTTFDDTKLVGLDLDTIQSDSELQELMRNFDSQLEKLDNQSELYHDIVGRLDKVLENL